MLLYAKIHLGNWAGKLGKNLLNNTKGQGSPERNGKGHKSVSELQVTGGPFLNY